MTGKLDASKLTSLLSQDGYLSKIVPSYEVREGQLQLLSSIYKCISEEVMGAFEAGTGIGKSFAYLIPCIEEAVRQGKRIVISTATINLQNQLITKDIPIVCNLLKVSKDEIKLALVKGRGNYICLRKLEDKVAEMNVLQNDLGLADINTGKKEVKTLYDWAENSATGDKEDLNEKVREDLWAELASDGETCLGSLCPHIGSCFVAKMRVRAENALIIVTNHHVLFADIKVKMNEASLQDDVQEDAFPLRKDETDDRQEEKNEREKQTKKMPSVLPHFQYVIFDEAHSLKKTALSFFSTSLSKKELKKYLSLLFLQTARGKKSGIMVELSYSLKEVNIKTFESIHDAVLETFARLEVFALHLIITSHSNSFSCAPLSFAIEDIASSNQNEIMALFDNFYKALLILTQEIGHTLEVLKEKEELKEERHKLSLVMLKLSAMLSLSASFVNWKEEEDVVFWAERRSKLDENELIFIRTPLNVASILKTYLFARMKSAINVSATLKVGLTFGYFLNGIGLREEDFKIEKGYFPSPFLYEENVLLSVPSDIPLPTHPSFQAQINKAILKLIEATRGRALVLFTSYQSLKTAADYAKENIKKNIAIYAQGDDEHSRLLHAFKTDISSCLFATMSFWEGIDVPGEALSNLILVKLPFTVPNHPVSQARARALEHRGFNSFLSLQVPEAAILFKQGFGRLIRSQQDRGVVTVLDNRLITKPYGKLFLDSIPKTKRCFAKLNEIVEKIKEFV